MLNLDEREASVGLGWAKKPNFLFHPIRIVIWLCLIWTAREICASCFPTNIIKIILSRPARLSKIPDEKMGQKI